MHVPQHNILGKLLESVVLEHGVERVIPFLAVLTINPLSIRTHHPIVALGTEPYLVNLLSRRYLVVHIMRTPVNLSRLGVHADDIARIEYHHGTLSKVGHRRY